MDGEIEPEGTGTWLVKRHLTLSGKQWQDLQSWMHIDCGTVEVGCVEKDEFLSSCNSRVMFEPLNAHLCIPHVVSHVSSQVHATVCTIT